MLNFEVTTERDGSSALVRFKGDLDIQVAERAARTVEEVEGDEPSLLVFDLSGLSFLDSSGMAVIAAAYARSVDDGRRFVIVNPRGFVRRAFEVSGLDQSMETVDALEDVYPASGAS